MNSKKMKSYRYIKIYTGGHIMNSKPINELIEEPTFKEELKNFYRLILQKILM
jgi:hypothetical protein